MSIENRGESKWRFIIRKDGINYTMNSYESEKEAENEHKKFEADVMRGNIGYNENMKFSGEPFEKNNYHLVVQGVFLILMVRC